MDNVDLSAIGMRILASSMLSLVLLLQLGTKTKEIIFGLPSLSTDLCVVGSLLDPVPSEVHLSVSLRGSTRARNGRDSKHFGKRTEHSHSVPPYIQTIARLRE
jgi:hypothetical protein